jgi:hypothetical protein
VHACWDDASLQLLDQLPQDVDLVSAYEQFEAHTVRDLEERGWLDAQERAERALGDKLYDESFDMPMQPGIGRADEYRQMNNPIRVLTSGVERLAKKPFFSSKKWRFADRVPWWDEYEDTADVICGHYWRWPVPVDRAEMGKGDPDLFERVPIEAWHGKERRAFCVDYGVGRRAAERTKGATPPDANNKLAALRWNAPAAGAPPIQVMFDDGKSIDTTRS